MNDGLKWPGQLLHCHTQPSFCVKSSTKREKRKTNKKKIPPLKVLSIPFLNTEKVISFPIKQNYNKI
jgi:hypothetical protein